MQQSISSTANGNIVDLQAYTRRRRLEEVTGEGFDPLERKDEATGEKLHEIKQMVANIEIVVEEIREKIDEKALPENIYQIIGGFANDRQSGNELLKIRELIQNGMQHLDRARLEFVDEIVRESELDLFFNNIRKIALIPSKSTNFEDAITALLVSLQGNVANSYTREKIRALKSVAEMLIDNIFMSEDVLEQCIDSLEEAGFDLMLPLKEIEFHDLL